MISFSLEKYGRWHGEVYGRKLPDHIDCVEETYIVTSVEYPHGAYRYDWLVNGKNYHIVIERVGEDALHALIAAMELSR